MLLPAPDDDSRAFWAYCAAGELRVQRCASCGRRRMPPRPMCPSCRSFDAEWELLSGRGTVWSFAVPHPPLLPAYAEQAPYGVIVVALDEDPTLRMVGNLVTEAGAPLNSVDPHTIEVGEPVEVVFAPVERAEGEDLLALPQWRRR
ncbi:MAG: OB-fold domain-containing protein [Actinobacteria bacterium]|nr:OB-fold domain-containing protein [Actinomycetota bacterium]